MNIVFTDRSRIETHGECSRRRWHEYHEGGMGLRPARVSLYLARGSAVHAGLTELLKGAMLHKEFQESTGKLGLSKEHWERVLEAPSCLADLEETAVKAALADFASFGQALAVDATEEAALKTPIAIAQDIDLAGLSQDERLQRTVGLFDVYLYKEQCALVEGLVRAWARRRLRPLLEQYEVLEVEREGSWLLSTVKAMVGSSWDKFDYELWFMSRPDALLLERQSRQLYLLSFKTTGQWDVRKARDIEHDMQGLSEGVEIEKRLGAWWKPLRTMEEKGMHTREIRPHNPEEWVPSPRMIEYLKGLPSPPQILGVRYEFLLCGERMVDKDLTQSMGVEVRSQRSLLCRAYLDSGMTSGDERWAWSYDFKKEDGTNGRLHWKSWRGTSVWVHMKIKEWIDKLEASTETIGEESRVLGYSSTVQQGYTAEHPLDTVFIPPVVVYRNDDDLRDWIEEVEASERRVAESVEQVRGAKDEAEKRHLLNVLFPRNRRSCEYPSSCAFIPLCFGGADIRRDPMGSGRYKVREANHPQEVAK